MLKSKTIHVVLSGFAVVLMTAAAGSANTTTQDVKDKTAAAAQKTAEVVTDASITSAVKTKFLADTTVSGLAIDVDTKDGVVTLTGHVKNATEKNRALYLARETSGVKHVTSKLTLETPEHKDAEQKTKDGVDKAATATKDGTVKAAKATKDGVETAAKDTKKVAVKGEDVVADAAITSEVKTKFLADTQVSGLKINVDTKDNVVTLTGDVSSATEKNEALRLARTTSGVKRVVDKLTIK